MTDNLTTDSQASSLGSKQMQTPTNTYSTSTTQANGANNAQAMPSQSTSSAADSRVVQDNVLKGKVIKGNGENNNAQNNNTSNSTKDVEHNQANTSDASSDTTDLAAQVTYKPVEIMVHGKFYTVNCPIGEEAGLRQAGKHINEFMHQVRRQAPQLSHDELLVLCCLDMFESLQSLKNAQIDKSDSEQKALNLINKMLNDTESMIN